MPNIDMGEQKMRKTYESIKLQTTTLAYLFGKNPKTGTRIPRERLLDKKVDSSIISTLYRNKFIKKIRPNLIELTQEGNQVSRGLYVCRSCGLQKSIYEMSSATMCDKTKCYMDHRRGKEQKLVSPEELNKILNDFYKLFDEYSYNKFLLTNHPELDIELMQDNLEKLTGFAFIVEGNQGFIKKMISKIG